MDQFAMLHSTNLGALKSIKVNMMKTGHRCATLSLAACLSAVCLPGSAAAANTKAIRFGRLVDGMGKNVADAVVVVEGGRITRVGSGNAALPRDAEVIDLSQYTGIPGLIDAHTHMTFYWDKAPGTRPWRQLDGRSAAVTVFLAQENARKTLEAGVTTVRDLGASEYADVAMRDLINRGAMRGPRMFVAGHGLHVSLEPARPGVVSPAPGRADGVPEVLRAVRQQISAGADVIKMYGSTGSDQDVTGNQTFTFKEMKAGVVAAHQAGKRIAIHSYGPDGARDAVRAGADSVEHATDLDDETISEMARRKTFYVPTIDHNRYYVDHRDEFGYGPEVAERLNGYLKRNLETARRAHKAGVRFAMGSDAVFTMFGENAHELAWFVKAGMTPAEALATATTNGAALLGMEKSLGAIAPGYHADIVAVDGDPLKDIDVVIHGVRWVMKAGEVVVDRTCERGIR
jgi:imidazolonepropionase-like amidohydrolase